MTILFEPYNYAEGRSHLPLAAVGRALDEGGWGRLTLVSHGEGTQGQSGHGQAVVELHALGADLAAANDGFGFAQLTLDAYGDDAQSTVTAPDRAIGAATIVLAASGAGTQANHGTGHAKLPLRAWGTNMDGIGRATLPLHVWAYDGGENARRATLVQTSRLVSTMVSGDTIQARAGFGISGQARSAWVMVLGALLRLRDAPAHLLDGQSTLRDRLAIAGLPAVILQLLVAEALAMGATPQRFVEATQHVADALALAAGPGSLLDARDTVAAALPLHDASMFVWPAAMREALALSGVQTSGMEGAQQMVDALALSAVPAGCAEFAMLVDETLALTDAPTSAAELFARIREGVDLLATFHLPDGGAYTAWVLHGDTRAYSSYSNFPFNSFCELDGHYYGATDSGLYLLEGDDDAGTPIEAHIRGGLSDMGTGKLKRMPSMYLGYRADGGLVLKVVTTSEGGEKREDWYALSAQPAEAVREGRIKIGRGLKSRYWGFELANVDGGDFELDSIAWLPMVLERRI